MPLFAPRMLYIPTAAPAAAAGGLVPVRTSWGNTKPSLGTQVNPSSPYYPTGGAWILNEGGGSSVYDATGSTNTGTFSNSPLWVIGKGGLGISFLRTSSKYITFPKLPFIGTQGRAVSARFATTDITAGGANCIFSLDIPITGGTTGNVFTVNCENGVIWVRTAGGVTGSWGSGYNDGLPHRVVITFPSGGTMSQTKCWVDGKVLSGTFTLGTTALNTSSSCVMWLGGDTTLSGSGNNYYFNGTIYDIETWGYQLPDTAAATYSTNIAPFAFMQPRTLWLPTGAGAAPTFSPFWANRSSLAFGGVPH